MIFNWGRNRIMSDSDLDFKARIVYLILSNDAEKALKILSSYYNVNEPKLKVGMPKRFSKNPACYVPKNQTIFVSKREIISNPQFILHEFYHHLRRVLNAQGGIEKYADNFAKNYILAYNEKINLDKLK